MNFQVNISRSAIPVFIQMLNVFMILIYKLFDVDVKLVMKEMENYALRYLVNIPSSQITQIQQKIKMLYFVMIFKLFSTCNKGDVNCWDCEGKYCNTVDESRHSRRQCEVGRSACQIFITGNIFL